MTHPPVRVVTYNILGGRHRRPLAQVVRLVRPDVLLVNESPKQRLLWPWQCRRLAADWKLRYVAGGRSAGSNMIVVSDRVKVLSRTARSIPQPPATPIRGVVTVQAAIDGRPVGFVGCHLSLMQDRRAWELRDHVLVAARALDGPVVLGGDLNESPGQPTWQLLSAAGFVDHADEHDFTYPARVPKRRIDAVFVRGGVTVLEQRTPEVSAELLAQASDHRPVGVLVDFTVQETR